jgi:hypothetical protein
MGGRLEGAAFRTWLRTLLERALQAPRLFEPAVSSLFHRLLPGNKDIAPIFWLVVRLRLSRADGGCGTAAPPIPRRIITSRAGIRPVRRQRCPGRFGTAPTHDSSMVLQRADGGPGRARRSGNRAATDSSPARRRARPGRAPARRSSSARSCAGTATAVTNAPGTPDILQARCRRTSTSKP